MSTPSSHAHRATGPTRPRRSSPGGVSLPSRSRAADWLGTAGWAAKGVVYLLIAVLAIQLALSGGAEEDEASKQGAMQAVADKPFGTVLLTLIVVGVLAYAAYRLLAVFLPGPSDDDATAALRKVSHVGSAVSYGAFGAQGMSLLVGGGSGGGGDGTRQSWSAVLLSSTLGTLVLLAVGLAFVGFAGWQVHKAMSRSFLDKLSCPSGSVLNRRNVERVGVAGLLARAVVAALVGLFVVLSVWQHDPSEVRGFDGALRTVVGAPAGPPLLAAVALGLAAYGLFCLVSARCRRHEAG